MASLEHWGQITGLRRNDRTGGAHGTSPPEPRRRPLRIERRRFASSRRRAEALARRLAVPGRVWLAAAAVGPSAAEREEALQLLPPFTPPPFPTPTPTLTVEPPETPATSTPPVRPSPPPQDQPPSCPSKALLGVYSPERLHVVARCTWF